MVHLYKKIVFITTVMEELGFYSKSTIRAVDEDRVVYWLHGLSGFYNYNTKESVSFKHAQMIAKHLIRLLKYSDSRHRNSIIKVVITPELKYKPILTYTKIAEIVGYASEMASYQILVGDFGGVTYCSRKKLVKDERNGITLSIVRNN